MSTRLSEALRPMWRQLELGRAGPQKTNDLPGTPVNDALVDPPTRKPKRRSVFEEEAAANLHRPAAIAGSY